VDINTFTFAGRLTKEPETRVIAGTDKEITRFSVACNNAKDKPADFFNCTAFNKNSENAKLYLHKGTQVFITGRLKTYRNKENVTLYEVVVGMFQITANTRYEDSEPKEEHTETDAEKAARNVYEGAGAIKPKEPLPPELISSDDLPF